MSEMDMDARPRMKDTMKPEDLNTEACITLAQTILGEAGMALMHAVRRYNEWLSKEDRAHLETCRAFYRSDLFVALSCGVADGETVIRQLTKQALLGRKGIMK
jgi:hypothetical protein